MLPSWILTDFLGDTAAISTVSNSYRGMLRGQISGRGLGQRAKEGGKHRTKYSREVISLQCWRNDI